MYTNQLSEYLSAEKMIALAETYGGTRLRIPDKAKDDHPLVMAIGRDGLKTMQDIYGNDIIRIPICRQLRINHYRAAGLSNPQIAVRLTMTEPGVSKAIKTMQDRGELLPKQHRPRTNVRNVQGINREARCQCCEHYIPGRFDLPVSQQVTD